MRDGLVFGPVVDGVLIPGPTVEAIRLGNGSDKALLVGCTDHEFNMSTAGAGPLLPKEPDAALLERLGASPEIAEAYLASHRGLPSEVLAGQYVSDRIFRTPTLNVAEARAGSAAPTWVYRFAWRSPVTGDAGHCFDIPFFFDVTSAERVAAIAGDEPPAALAADVHGAAVAFIRDGQPGWTPWDAGDHQVRVFDEPSIDVEDGYADVRLLQHVPSVR